MPRNSEHQGVRQVADNIWQYPKVVPLGQIVKQEGLENCYVMETENAYFLIRL